MTKILLVDDHKMIRDGIRAMLSHTKNVEIVGECEDGSQVLSFLESNSVDIIFMDVSMPQQNGIETTVQVLKKYPEAKVIALTMHNQAAYITKMLQAGAVGYVLKNTNCNYLIQAILTVSKGSSCFSKEVSEIIVARFIKKTISVNYVKPYVNPHITSVKQLTFNEIKTMERVRMN